MSYWKSSNRNRWEITRISFVAQSTEGKTECERNEWQKSINFSSLWVHERATGARVFQSQDMLKKIEGVVSGPQKWGKRKEGLKRHLDVPRGGSVGDLKKRVIPMSLSHKLSKN